MVLEHLLSPCLWLLSMKTGFFLRFLNGNVEVLKVLGNMNVKLVTQCLKLSTTKVLLSGFYLMEMSLPFHLVSSFFVLRYCVL